MPSSHKKSKKSKRQDNEDDLSQSLLASPQSESKEMKKRKSTADSHSDSFPSPSPKKSKDTKKRKSISVDADESLPTLTPLAVKKQRKEQSMSLKDYEVWDKESIVKLMETIDEATKNDKNDYKKQLKNMSWKTLGNEFKNRSILEIKEAVFSIIRKIGTVKSIAQIMSDAKEYLLENEEGHMSFDFQDSYAAKYFSSKQEGTENEIEDKWKTLSKKEKAEIKDYVKQLTEMPPFQYHLHEIWMRDFKKTLSDQNIEGLKLYMLAQKEYLKLEEPDRLKLFKRFVKYLDRYMDEVNEFMKINPSLALKIKFPPIKEIEMYFKHIDCPQPPPSKEMLWVTHQNKRLLKSGNVPEDKVVLAAFRNESRGVKEKFQKRYERKYETYESDLRTWAKSSRVAHQVLTTHLLANRKKSKKTEKKWNEVETVVKQVKFDHPKRPHISAYEIFKEKMGPQIVQKNTSSSPLNIKNEFNKLTVEKKEYYKSKAQRNRNKYVDSLLRFTESLTLENLRHFLGYNRVHFYKFLGEDIFEKSYPNEQYPVLIYQKSSDMMRRNDDNFLSSSDDTNIPVKKEVTSPHKLSKKVQEKLVASPSKPKEKKKLSMNSKSHMCIKEPSSSDSESGKSVKTKEKSKDHSTDSDSSMDTENKWPNNCLNQANHSSKKARQSSVSDNGRKKKPKRKFNSNNSSANSSSSDSEHEEVKTKNPTSPNIKKQHKRKSTPDTSSGHSSSLDSEHEEEVTKKPTPQKIKRFSNSCDKNKKPKRKSIPSDSSGHSNSSDSEDEEIENKKPASSKKKMKKFANKKLINNSVSSDSSDSEQEKGKQKTLKKQKNESTDVSSESEKENGIKQTERKNSLPVKQESENESDSDSDELGTPWKKASEMKYQSPLLDMSY